MLVLPSPMTGNTDTRWSNENGQFLSANIFRFTPVRTEDMFNIHTVDERITIDGHVEGIRFLWELIGNADAAQ